MTGRRKRRPAVSAKQRAWFDSARMVEVRRAATSKSLEARRSIQKCGAKTRAGSRCQNAATANGRCRMHSGTGTVGSGRLWHVVLLPADPVKRARKLRDVERRRAKQAARVAAMSEAERARYFRRSKAMQPGTPAERAQRRQDSTARAHFEQMQTEPRSVAPQIARLDAIIAELEAQRIELQRGKSDE